MVNKCIACDNSIYSDDWVLTATGPLHNHCAAGEIATLRARVAELEAVVDKLPRTADGVTITDGMVVYDASVLKGYDCRAEARLRVMLYNPTFPWPEDRDYEANMDTIFSTLAAAEAARKEAT